MQDAVALSLAFALAAPIRVVLAHAAPEPGAERQYTYLGLFSVSRCHLYAPPPPLRAYHYAAGRTSAGGLASV